MNADPQDCATPAALSRAIEDKLRLVMLKSPQDAKIADWHAAAALVLRDAAAERWMQTGQSAGEKGKRVYYLSMEFLIGRLMTDIAANLGLIEPLRMALSAHGQDFDAIRNYERDAALGSGGLGRLAACFMESMASTGVRGMGYGIRYEQGMLRQDLRDGWQADVADDWLRNGNPWEVERATIVYETGFGGWVEAGDGGKAVWHPNERITAVAYDTPIVGWRAGRVNTLRLWSARSPELMRLDIFNRGDYPGAFAEHSKAASISQVLYPDDSTAAGKELRLKQEFFFTSASLQDLVQRHIQERGSLESLPEHAAIQLNDTHPALAVAELMRLLIDEHGFELKRAFALTQQTLCYTNHTLLPEALETWPHALFAQLLPRHLQIINEINAVHLQGLSAERQTAPGFTQAVSLIDEQNGRRVRMGHLAFLGSRRVNGVSGLHGELMRETVFADLHALFPERITHVTNGITFRRWLMQCNPGLTGLIKEGIGPDFLDYATELENLRSLARDASFQERYADVKRANKRRLADAINERIGVRVDPGAMFDVQIKRIHEYKRQQLNILETIAHYHAIRAEPDKNWVPRVKIFAGKSAASYHRAKLIIKLINDAAAIINNDPVIGGRLKIAFLPNYNVSLAEIIIPAADLSEQISTAGMEASGTGNMKLALNGALTIGTLDGANVEIRDQAGNENILIFGLTAAEVAAQRREGHDPGARIAASPALRQALKSLRSGEFSGGDEHRFAPIADDLMNSDFFMVTADFDAYANAQRKADALYAAPGEWLPKAIANTASMGWFSSDRSIRQYAKEIWLSE